MIAQTPFPTPYPTPVGSTQIGLVPKDTHPEYVTWADSPDGAVSVKINGIDAREALLALDLLRKKDSAYEGLRISNSGSISLIQKLFLAEFGSALPPVGMARHMGANIRSHDAEAVIAVLRDCSVPY